MANMDHCRFHNTLEDLDDCFNHMGDDDLSEAEAEERTRLIRLCVVIADWYKEELEEEKQDGANN